MIGAVACVVFLAIASCSSAQQCGGGPKADGCGGQEEGEMDYSFDGMPKPKGWREMEEYQYLLNDATAPTQKAAPRGGRQSKEERDMFDEWEKELADAEDTQSNENFLASKAGKMCTAGLAGLVLTFVLLRLKSSSRNSVDGDAVVPKKEEERKAEEKAKKTEPKKSKQPGKKAKASAQKKKKAQKGKVEGDVPGADEPVEEKKPKKETAAQKTTDKMEEEDDGFVLVGQKKKQTKKKKKKKSRKED